jgi:hypothetical protein
VVIDHYDRCFPHDFSILPPRHAVFATSVPPLGEHSASLSEFSYNADFAPSAAGILPLHV